MKTSNVIDLEDFRVKDQEGNISKVFTGRDRGRTVRINSQIDKLETIYDTIIIKIPKDVYSINPSFFEEFLSNVVNKLNRKGFYEKFQFICEGNYNYKRSLDEGITRILRKKSALG